ncbi:MAG: MopE-related protein, partial [Myxococcota bacterium]
MWWLLLPQSAYALGDDVLMYTGNSGFEYLDLYGPDPFLDVMTDEGCVSEGTEDSSGFPTDLSDYSIVMLLLNSARFTSSEVSLMSDFIDDGGLLVLAGDSTSFDSAHVTNFNRLLSDLGISSSFAASSSYDTGCSRTASVSSSHFLSTDISSLAYGWSGDVVAGTDGTEVFVGRSGQGIVVVEDRVVLISDLNILLDTCTAVKNNEQFFLNLYAYSISVDDYCDLDEDGVDSDYCAGDDCDDCDKSVGDDTETYYHDLDEDGYGDPDRDTVACSQPSGTVTNNDDCDDTDDTINPDGIEVCNEVDDDCDGSVDEGVSTFYFDMDGDGFGDSSDVVSGCTPPTGYVAVGGDCDDDDDAQYPG